MSALTGLAVLVALVASLILQMRGVCAETRAALGSCCDLVVQRVRGGLHVPLGREHVDRIAAVPGVRAATPRVWGYAEAFGAGAPVAVWGADSVPPGLIGAEGWPGARAPTAPGCRVGAGLARRLRVKPGATLSLRGADGLLVRQRVEAVFVAPSARHTHGLAILPTAEARALLGLSPTGCTDIGVQLDSRGDPGAARRAIAAVMADARSMGRDEMLVASDAGVAWRAGVWSGALGIAAVTFLTLSWLRAATSSGRHAQLLALLRAAGWSPREILHLLLLENVLVATAAAALGLTLAEVGSHAAVRTLFSPVIHGWSVSLPGPVASAHLDGVTVLSSLILVLVPFLLAVLVPSWRSAAPTGPQRPPTIVSLS